MCSNAYDASDYLKELAALLYVLGYKVGYEPDNVEVYMPDNSCYAVLDDGRMVYYKPDDRGGYVFGKLDIRNLAQILQYLPPPPDTR